MSTEIESQQLREINEKLDNLNAMINGFNNLVAKFDPIINDVVEVGLDKSMEILPKIATEENRELFNKMKENPPDVGALIQTSVAVKNMAMAMGPIMGNLMHDLTGFINAASDQDRKKLADGFAEKGRKIKSITGETAPAAGDMIETITGKVSEIAPMVINQDTISLGQKALASTPLMNKVLDAANGMDNDGTIDKILASTPLVTKMLDAANNMDKDGTIDKALASTPLVTKMLDAANNMDKDGTVDKALASTPLVTKMLDAAMKMNDSGSLDKMLKLATIMEKMDDAQVDNMVDAISSMTGLLEKTSDPKVIKFLEGTLTTLTQVDTNASQSTFGLLGAMGDKEVKNSLGIMMDLAKKLPRNIK